MNKSFKSIWNEALGAWVAASELDRARGKRVASSRSASVHAADAGIATKPALSPRRLVVMMTAAYLGLFQAGAHAQYSAGGGSATGGASSTAI
ncbi:ESPR domain-containing protein, partial [Burkholderia cenocepacia]|nr:ESPR domain-containing protein [Burkholderia cenocepacia]